MRLFSWYFKLSKVGPVFKKGCRFQLNSYRPISIASLVCKLYEKLVLLQITEFLNDNNLLCPDQFVFVQASNTEISFIPLIKHITDNLGLSRSVAVIFIDLSTAFNSIYRDIIISKLFHQFGFRGVVLNFLNS